MFLIHLLYAAISVWVLWVFFLAWTHLEKVEAEGKLSAVSNILGKPVKLVGLSIDLVVNVSVATVIFLDPPREGTVSTRMCRYLNGRDGWRKALSQWCCTNLLDVFDIDGKHCK